MSFRDEECSFNEWSRDSWKVKVGVGGTLPPAPSTQVQET